MDPQKDLAAWRSLATASGAITLNVKTLSFPYLHRSPRELLLNPELSARGPDAGHFGMIAHAHLNLPVGKWRFRVSGGGGVRVIVDGRTILENWSPEGDSEKVAEHQQLFAVEAEIVVEHFVADGVAGFQLLLEPITQ